MLISACVCCQVSHLVGKPNTAAAADPEAEEQGFAPHQGHPASASPKEASTGGAAGYIAPEAAEAAKHSPHDQVQINLMHCLEICARGDCHAVHHDHLSSCSISRAHLFGCTGQGPDQPSLRL